MSTSSNAATRRLLTARVFAVLLTAGLSCAGALAQDKSRYEGIQKVEVFTQLSLPIKAPKNPPFELKVYRMDGFQRANEALERVTPKGMPYAEKQAWQKNYTQTHPDFDNKWTDLIVESMAGMQSFRGYNTRGRVPAIVINGSWVLVDETDVDKAIKLYRQQERH